MGMRINTNVSSLSAQRTLSTTNRNMNDNLRKLSSGERITRAADDAAGLAISENLKAQIRGMRQAKRNANDAISLIQTAEGGLNEISNIIIRLRELSVQAANDTLGPEERKYSDIEFQNLKEEIDRISRSSEFNGVKLLDGTGGRMEFQVGIHNDPINDRLVYDGTGSDATISTLGLSADNVASKEGAQSSLQKLDDALVQVNGIRANMGALQNRLSSTVNNLGISDENLSAAKSRIRDVDIAAETAELAKNNILIQSGTSVLSQANQFPSIANKLLG
ncbi:flagellin [Halobacteriovorax marinus]|uniref:Flagellin n=1 Tax=Halobacteriovorax marinus (strain ATCC BAA-682 / DSM 15412 / SJ) TaxID=862908 RepID=E1X2Q8_HALMS|nr:flagellin [Halobacteriovorax marinus]ATH06537.1 flagellin [Halobacteriovorax marinus]CBW25103.1 flagellin subunit [Halobacteriovorax marinus SJ]